MNKVNENGKYGNDGFCTYYRGDDKNTIWYTVNHIDGVEHGEYCWYHYDGSLGLTGHYINGKRAGLWIDIGKDDRDRQHIFYII